METEIYECVEDRNGYSYLTGLCIELLRVIAEQAGYRVVMDNVPRRRHIEDIETSERDVQASLFCSRASGR
jgi:hypothetical protein